ncbi:isoflavone reductase family protein [Phyllosticta capitalensis]|uniref:Isoflavone reductase family protein n=1 Tax=Phyllosticta capitalensis TaxID=121624 RepID=A0ABR1YJ17_9PEZI
MSSPPPPSERIIIFGATGKIGTYITSAIASASPPFARVAIYTSPGTVKAKAAHIAALKERGVEVLVGELTDEERVREVLGKDSHHDFDTLVSCLGRSILSQQTTLLRLAASRSSSIRRVFPSEYGTDVLHPVTPDPHAEPPHRFKLEARALRSLSYTYLVTGPYADMYVGMTGRDLVTRDAEQAWDRAGGFDVRRRRATLLCQTSPSPSSSSSSDDNDDNDVNDDGTDNGKDDVADDRIALTGMRDVGRFLVASLRLPGATHNRALRVHSFVTSPREILREFRRQLNITNANDKNTANNDNTTPWTVRHVDLAELQARERRAYERGDPEKGLFSVRRIWTSGGTLYEGQGGRDNEVLGDVQRETLEGVVREEVGRQMGGEGDGEGKVG